VSVRVQTEDFCVQREYDEVVSEAGDAGAVVLFCGLVRELYDGSESSADCAAVATLTLEHYPGMTEKALAEIEAQACTRWPLLATRIVHRVGELSAKDQIVLVLAASPHRHAAFEAAEFMMDFLKSRAPFWKKQSSANGSIWIDSRESDAQSLQRW
jgi:molybdopterin synthase catalytic subunit